jgi:hypothetical protein
MNWGEQGRMVPCSLTSPPLVSRQPCKNSWSLDSGRDAMDKFSVDLDSVVVIIGGAPQSSHMTR